MGITQQGSLASIWLLENLSNNGERLKIQWAKYNRKNKFYLLSLPLYS